MKTRPATPEEIKAWTKVEVRRLQRWGLTNLSQEFSHHDKLVSEVIRSQSVR